MIRLLFKYLLRFVLFLVYVLVTTVYGIVWDHKDLILLFSSDGYNIANAFNDLVVRD